MQHIILADGTHLPLGLCHLVELLGRLQVLIGNAHLFACNQQAEEEADRLHRHLLRLCEETRLCLTVPQWLDATVPFQVVHAEEGLRERDGNRERHELVAATASRLMQEV